MHNLINEGFNKDKVLSQGNMFLIGNGHLGYRGTLEEFMKEENVGFNVVGFYDQFENKWRESVNMPNPLHIKIKNHSILKNKPLFHQIKLEIKKAIFKRKTRYSDLIINSERFINSDDTLILKYQIKALKDISTKVSFGLDTDIFEINGPHFKEKRVKRNNHYLFFKGITNENKEIYENVYYDFKGKFKYLDNHFVINLDLKENEIFTIKVFAKVSLSSEPILFNNYEVLRKMHVNHFNKLWGDSRVKILGNEEAQFYTDYSIYHLLILNNDQYEHSIPARGLSGQTYKGAIFWDTEIFLLPFYTLTNPNTAKNLIKYRINTLNGAKAKAKEFGFDGAFYAWESQETGLEACSKYNITDAITGEPIRTYFNEKQIHISFDIAYAVLKYMAISGDYKILDFGARVVLDEIANFAMSYAKIGLDNKYHFNDVIGPDEYHERIDDNAFTNYMAYYALKESLPYLSENVKVKVSSFVDDIYLNEINNGLIEQFDGYYNLEICSVSDIKNRLKTANEYWGVEAKKTRVIKQADLITLLALHHEKFSDEVVKANYDFYEKVTEHGSSLSASMYSLTASRIGYLEDAYKMFIKSASIDLGANQKMYAGGIYIGGTHPASNAGAYLSLIFGFAGLIFNDDSFDLSPRLPAEIKGLEFKIYFKDKHYQIKIDENESIIEEVS